jgi:hypothetical protein
VQGNWVVTCGEDHCAYLFALKNHKLTLQRLLDRGEAGLFTAAFSYANDLVALAGYDLLTFLLVSSSSFPFSVQFFLGVDLFALISFSNFFICLFSLESLNSHR